MLLKIKAAALATTMVACSFILPAAADVSFEGKTITVGIGSDPGGGTDLVGRLVAQYIGQYLPGEPTVVIQNFGGGVGSKLRAANNLVLDAPKDGTYVLQGDNTPVQPETVRRKEARYDPRKFNLVGSINRGGRLLFVRKDARARLNDPNAEPVIVGGRGQEGWQIILTTAKEYLGWNLRWIPGFDADALRRALLQGEIDMFATGSAVEVAELVNEGVVDLVVQEGQFRDGKYISRAKFDEVPIYPDLLAAANPPKIALEGYNTVQLPGVVDKWLALPPDTPEDVVTVWREAYGKLFADEKFMAAAKTQISDEIYFIPGEDAETLFVQMLDVSEEAVNFSADLRKKFGITD